VSALLDARLRVRRGSFLLDAELHVERGEVLALLGPNGSGKSTLLGALAGLVPLESGMVVVSGRTLTRHGGRDRVSVPPERRGVGLLGQDPLLFPHLSALENVAFGRRARGVAKRVAREDARKWLRDVGLDGFGARKPAQLSGGQQQRVAIARALAARPEVMLLDEPLAAVDVQTASAMRQLLRERLVETDTTTILVTHDVMDALVVADRVAILQDGRIIDEGPNARVLGVPRNQFIAALAGVNLVVGVADGVGLRCPDGRRFVGKQEGARPASGDEVAAIFSPSAVSIATEAPHAQDEPNRWSGVVTALEPWAGRVRVRVSGDHGEHDVIAELSAFEVAERALAVGRPAWLAVAEDAVSLHAR
jgi:molybdate transport system ATP-binding protein